MARYYVSQLAYLASKLDAMPEGDGTVLDNCCLVFLSNMWSGSKHDSNRLPLMPSQKAQMADFVTPNRCSINSWPSAETKLPNQRC